MGISHENRNEIARDLPRLVRTRKSRVIPMWDARERHLTSIDSAAHGDSLILLASYVILNVNLIKRENSYLKKI